uniref:Uncharacterized protein LOC111110666 isoform X2 n=1 Tax=Crassostrea virginica TaxID=6565 RepID=A0A8B8BJ50_CRAVI|nr:uncharacterized protein LOC111110666 isoform X2 [Crassostrea virginica]
MGRPPPFPNNPPVFCPTPKPVYITVQVHKKCPTDSKTTSYTKTSSMTEPSTPIATSQRGIVSTFLPTNEQFTISKPLFRTVVKAPTWKSTLSVGVFGFALGVIATIISSYLHVIMKKKCNVLGNGMSSDMNGTQTQHTNQNQETHYYSLN